MKIQLDFVKHYKLWFLLSGMLVLVALLGIFMRGLNYGIDFTGGTQMVVKYPRPVTSAAVSRVLKKENLSQSQVLFMGSSHQEVQITTPTISEHERNLVLAKLKTVGNYQEISTNRVSGIVGAQTGRTALLAVLIATAAIIIYIAIRFEMRFALAGIIALLLDVVITVGVVALIHVTLTVYFIMSVLTIFGYSMNDRIIVFDRIREKIMTLASTAMPIDKMMPAMSGMVSTACIAHRAPKSKNAYTPNAISAKNPASRYQKIIASAISTIATAAARFEATMAWCPNVALTVVSLNTLSLTGSAPDCSSKAVCCACLRLANPPVISALPFGITLWTTGLSTSFPLR